MDKKIEKLFILPFDHRASFLKKMFGIDGRQPTEEEAKMVADYKKIIYEGFKKAVTKNLVPKRHAAILVDEQFGDEILRDAGNNGYLFCLATEKSGQDEFDFEYGDDFGQHIEKYEPKIVKALLRYNAEGDDELNRRQLQRLKKLSDYCQDNGYIFLVEPLIPATDQQLAGVGNDKNRYDKEVRPALTVKMIKGFQSSGVEPDIWKIEGFEYFKDYQSAVKQIKADGRNASAIVLGRGADKEQVEKWLTAGAKVEGVIGFAVGRTIFWQALFDFKDGKISREEAAEQIGGNYSHFYQVFSS